MEPTQHSRTVEKTACAANPVSQGGEDAFGMFRDQVYAEMEEALGLVPSFFARMPDATMEFRWEFGGQTTQLPNSDRTAACEVRELSSLSSELVAY